MYAKFSLLTRPSRHKRVPSVNDANVLANAAFLGGSGSGGGAGGFRLHYDVETPLRTIDVGGPDQEQR